MAGRWGGCCPAHGRSSVFAEASFEKADAKGAAAAYLVPDDFATVVAEPPLLVRHEGVVRRVAPDPRLPRVPVEGRLDRGVVLLQLPRRLVDSLLRLQPLALAGALLEAREEVVLGDELGLRLRQQRVAEVAPPRRAGRVPRVRPGLRRCRGRRRRRGWRSSGGRQQQRRQSGAHRSGPEEAGLGRAGRAVKQTSVQLREERRVGVGGAGACFDCFD